MRDDIHRRLPLRGAWKRAVKACVRDAEAPLRPQLVERAIIKDLGTIRPVVLGSAHAGFAESEQSLFAEDAFAAVVCAPQNSVEASFIRESVAIAASRLPAAEAVPLALVRTAEECLASVDREITTQLALDRPKDCVELRRRFRDARSPVDVSGVVRRMLAGERSSPSPAASLDFDADLRSAR